MIIQTMKVYQASGEQLVINETDYDPRIHSTKKEEPPKRGEQPAATGRSDSGRGVDKGTDKVHDTKDAVPDNSFDSSGKAKSVKEKKASKKSRVKG